MSTANLSSGLSDIVSHIANLILERHNFEQAEIVLRTKVGNDSDRLNILGQLCSVVGTSTKYMQATLILASSYARFLSLRSNQGIIPSTISFVKDMNLIFNDADLDVIFLLDKENLPRRDFSQRRPRRIADIQEHLKKLQYELEGPWDLGNFPHIATDVIKLVHVLRQNLPYTNKPSVFNNSQIKEILDIIESSLITLRMLYLLKFYNGTRDDLSTVGGDFIRQRDILIANSFGECNYLRSETDHPILEFIELTLPKLSIPIFQYITLHGLDRINTNVLQEHITPFLGAIEQLQDWYNYTFSQPKYNDSIRITSIHNEIPKIELLGLDKVISALNQTISKQRRINKSRREEYQNEELKLANEARAIENEKARDNLQHERLLKSVETDPTILDAEKKARMKKLREETRALKIENDTKELALKERAQQLEQNRARFITDFSYEFLKTILGHTPSAEEISRYLPSIIGHTKTVLDSQVEMQIGHRNSSS